MPFESPRRQPVANDLAQVEEQATEEVSGPVVSIALILAAVFIPAGFMSGIQGRLEQAVRDHDCDRGDNLGVQRADALAGAGGDAAQAAQAGRRINEQKNKR